MKKNVSIEWSSDLVMLLRSKNIAWSSITKWYYVAIGVAFMAGVLIGKVL